jgi:prolyl oligopeptidase
MKTIRPRAAVTARMVAWMMAMTVLGSDTAWAQLPPAPSQPVTDTHHGVPVADPFRNLEDLKNPQTRAWMQDAAARTAAVLARIEGRDALRERIAELGRTTGDRVTSIQRWPGGRVTYLKRTAGQSLPTLILREGLQGAEKVLVDLNAVSRERNRVPHAINYSALSPDGRTLAYGLSAAGSEDASLHLLDVATGRLLREPIPRVHNPTVRWSADGRWLAFNQLQALPAGASATETFLDSTVMVLDARRPLAAPRAVFGPTVTRNLGLDRLDVGEVEFGTGSRWMLIRTTDTTVPEGKLFVAPLKALEQPAAVPWRQISSAADRITALALRGNRLYLRSYADAPRGRVLALELPRGDLRQAKVLVPEPARGVLRGFVLGREALYVEVQEGFAVRTLRHRLDGTGSGVDVAPSLQGLVFPLVDATATGADELWVWSGAWDMPPRVFALRGTDAPADTGLLRLQSPPGVPELQVSEFEVPSHDGVRVPVVVLHRKGLTLDGKRPTLLSGYGAYGITTLAFHDARRYAWLERDGVLAFVNPRGSGAYGDAWHRAGFKSTKPNTWKDGIAVAQALVARGYASPATLAVQGGSAGGIFVGRAVTEAPGLFAAALLDVGMLDAVRAEVSANGVTNISEFGTHKDPVEFRALLEMSTYHQIRDGVNYPAVLFTHGLNDPRVDPWHSTKTAARFAQARPDGKPVLLRLDAMAGHGGGETVEQESAKQADRWAFLLWQFGVLGLRP